MNSYWATLPTTIHRDKKRAIVTYCDVKGLLFRKLQQLTAQVVHWMDEGRERGNGDESDMKLIDTHDTGTYDTGTYDTGTNDIGTDDTDMNDIYMNDICVDDIDMNDITMEDIADSD
ncbi:hypothetical protein V8C42DRAFT_339443 [Trichoderma barbatum]